MNGTVAIVGAGIIGRVLAFFLNRNDWQVTLFDRSDRTAEGEAGNPQGCSAAAAGMLSPISELAEGNPLVYQLGTRSLSLWPGCIEALDTPVFFRLRGSLLIAHASDRAEWQRLHRVLQPLVKPEELKLLTSSEVIALEPEIDRRFLQGIYFPTEGQIDNREILTALCNHLVQQGVACRFGETVVTIEAHTVGSAKGTESFDWVVDCRGISARDKLKNLRGVRGELIAVKAPEVKLTRPIRLTHPRHPVYIVPRADSKYLIGATCLETEDLRPITVRSTLELLSAAFMVHAGFAEASIIETIVQLRPAFTDNKPKVIVKPGLVLINGLYRNGFCTAPAIAEIVSDFLLRARPGEHFLPELFEEVA